MAKLITPDMQFEDQMRKSGMEVNSSGVEFHEENDDDYNLNSDLNEPAEVTDGFNIPITIKDIQENIGTITALENSITDLVYLTQDISSKRGMCQDFALEAERLLPGFGGVPVGYYSKDISATRYKLAVEELSGGIWALIIAAVAALSALVYKFINWMFGKDSSSGGSSSNWSGENLEDVRDATKEVDNIVHNLTTKEFKLTPKAPDEPKPEVVEFKEGHYTIDEILNGKLYQFGPGSNIFKVLTTKDPIVLDILSKGEYYKTMIELSSDKSINSIKSAMDGLVSRIDDVVSLTDSIKSSDDVSTDLEKLVNLSHVEIDNLSPYRKYTPEMIQMMFHGLDKQINENNANAHFSFTNVYRIYLETLDGSMAINAMKHSQDLESHLTKLNDKLKLCGDKLESLKQPTDDETRIKLHKYSVALNKVISDAKSEIKQVMMVCTELQNFANALGHIGKDLITKVLKEAILTVERTYKRAGSEIPADLNDILTELKAIRFTKK